MNVKLNLKNVKLTVPSEEVEVKIDGLEYEVTGLNIDEIKELSSILRDFTGLTGLRAEAQEEKSIASKLEEVFYDLRSKLFGIDNKIENVTSQVEKIMKDTEDTEFKKTLASVFK